MARIAVLDRNANAAAEIVSVLTDLGHSSQIFVDEEAALLALVGKNPQEQPFEAALVGLRLRRLPGLVIVREIKAARPLFPVIVATDYPSVETMLEARRLGVADYLVKPLDVVDLRYALARAQHEVD